MKNATPDKNLTKSTTSITPATTTPDKNLIKSKTGVTPSQAIQNSNSKYPLSFLVKIKRGVSWSTRRVEIDREHIKYFKAENSELRFNERINDSALIAKNEDNLKKFYLVLVSKTGTFKEVKISHDAEPQILKNLKKEFDFIQNYKNTISDIQNKTFIIEKNDNNGENENNTVINKTILGDDFTQLGDDLTINKSILFENNNYIANNDNEIITNNIINNSINFNNFTNNKQNVINNENLFEEIKIKNKTTNERRESIIENDKAKDDLQAHNEYKIIENNINDDTTQNINTNLNTNNANNLIIENLENETWTDIKFTKNSLIQFNGPKENFLTFLYQNSDENIFKQTLNNEFINDIKDNFNKLNENQTRNLIIIIIILILTLGNLLKDNLTIFLIISTLILIISNFYLKSLKIGELKNNTNKNESKNKNDDEISKKIIKISSIFYETPKDMLSILTNIQNYKDWNLHLKSVNDFRKEDNSAKYIYSEDFEIRLKRKIIQNSEPIIILETFQNETHIKNKQRAKITVIESSTDCLKSKVIQYIPMKSIIEGKLPQSYLKSHLNNLDMLQIWINNKNFNNKLKALDKENEIVLNKKVVLNLNMNLNKKENYNQIINQNNTISKDFNLESIGKTYMENISNVKNENNDDIQKVKKSLTIIPTSKINLDPEQISLLNSTKLTEGINLKSEGVENITKIILNEFHEFDNKFSESLIKEEAEKTEININDNSTNNTNVKEEKNEIINPPHLENSIPVIPSVKIDSFLQKENEEISQLLKNKLSELKEDIDKKPWKVLEEKSDYKLFFYDEKTGFRSIKSEIVIEKNIKTVYDLILDLNQKSKYDKNYDCGHTIREVDDKISLQYLKYKGKFMISPRDFTLASLNKFVSYSNILFKLY